MAALREVQEEVGLTLGNVRPLENHKHYVHGKSYYFYAEARSRQIRIDRNEIKEASWFEVTNLPKDILSDASLAIDLYMLEVKHHPDL